MTALGRVHCQMQNDPFCAVFVIKLHQLQIAQ
jgi:hypothetical protein